MPKDDKGCIEPVQDAAPRKFSIPLNVATALATTKSKAWAFVKSDIDAQGNYINLWIVSSAGFKAFDDAALKTVAAWKAKIPAGKNGYQGCVSQVSIS